nr:type II toxin-antitoxin system PemK/MazF family toxin [uncultured Sphingosinicella sp.]
MGVPFPHVERPVVVPRPAIILNAEPLGLGGALIWTAMVTNAAREDWPGDVPIPEAELLGLLIPSKVRTAKIYTAEAASARKIGRLDEQTWTRVRDKVRAHLGF